MLICTLCPDGDNEIPAGMEFDHIKLMHSEVLNKVQQALASGNSPLLAGDPSDIAHHMIEMMKERIADLEFNLSGLRETTATSQEFRAKQDVRYRAMIEFCDWIVNAVDNGELLDLTHLAARAKQVRNVWPDKTTEERTQ